MGKYYEDRTAGRVETASFYRGQSCQNGKQADGGWTVSAGQMKKGEAGEEGGDCMG